MAEFCNKCSEQMFGEVYVDIDVYEIKKGLEDRYFHSHFICEGCALTAVLNRNDEVYVASVFHPDQDWLPYVEYWNKFYKIKENDSTDA